MEIELEKTFLVKYLPADLKSYKSAEIIDIYIPKSAEHPKLRLRKKGDVFEITKKKPIKGDDCSEQTEETIILTKEEFEELANVEGKRLRKIRYYYMKNNIVSEIDVYIDKLYGLVLADFEFATAEEKNSFVMPEFCLAEVTQEEYCAAGILAGKRYEDIEEFLEKYGYKKLCY